MADAKDDQTVMSRLHPLRARLTSLQRARAFVRNGAGWAAAAVTLALALAVVFVLDWHFRLGVPERVVVLLLAVAGIVWSWRKYTLPFVGVKEDLVQMALLVERQQQIDSDLVAALQFEGAPATAYGSTQLKTAVVDYVAQAAPGINVFDGFDRSGRCGSGGDVSRSSARLFPTSRARQSALPVADADRGSARER
jgi:hypothetical protein